MPKRKLKQYEIFKISVDRFFTNDKINLKTIPLNITYREAIENQEIVMIQNNQLIHKIYDYFADTDFRLSDIIVNIFIPEDLKKRGEKQYVILAKNGFDLNGYHYVRLCSGSGQIRRNTITFIREDLNAYISSELMCGLTVSDFGNSFNAAKYNAYFGLIMSGCHLLPDDLSPKVCVISDYEVIKPDFTVNYVTENEIDYITLPDMDFELTDTQSEYTVSGNKALRKSDKKSFTIRHGVKKNISPVPYSSIKGSPALNSFDGQGLMSPDWAQKVSEYLGLNYTPSALIIRAPWVKGLLATMPIHEYFFERGITEIKDIFGESRKIDDIDVFISASQFKMWKIYNNKCKKIGVNPWDYHQQQMKKNHLLWGIAKINNVKDDDIKAINYQYAQALMMDSDDVDRLCKMTEDYFKKLNSGDLQAVYNNLMVNGGDYYFDVADDYISDEGDNLNYKKLFQKVIEANPEFINDRYIREEILKECKVKITGAKLGKILVKGNFQFCISDPIAQLEWIIKNHCAYDVEVSGKIPAGHIYSNYWRNIGADDIVLMRSPLIDGNEIAKRRLIQSYEHYYRYLTSGIIYSIYDLTALQQGGCDFDGDITFSTNDSIILNSCYDFETAKPLYYDLQSTDLVGRISAINLISADKRGLNSAVGKISNKGGSLYAKLEKYDPDSREYKTIYDSIITLGQITGMEIDRIKTAVYPTMPYTWNLLQGIKYQDFNGDEIAITDDEEQRGIFRHNDMAPDLKPYYFKYNYDYIDKAIRDLNREFKKIVERTSNLKPDEVLARYNAGDDLSADDELIAKLYYNAYPVIDTDCIVNHISHRFEDFEKQIKVDSLSEGVNMLKDYISEIPPDDDMIAKATTIMNNYHRIKKFMMVKTNQNIKESRKSKAFKAHDRLIIMASYTRNKLLDLTDGDLQMVFDLLVCISKSERPVFEIMDSLVTRIIRRKNK